MAKKIGRLINLGLAKESSRGTAVAATNWLPKSNITFSDKVQKAVSQSSYGTIGEGNQELVALKWAEGDVEFDLVDKTFGLVALATFGTVSSGAFNSAYKHTYTLQNDNQHDSLTFWVEDVAESNDIFFELCMINSLNITAVPEDVVKCTANWVGKSSEDTSGLSASYVAENKFTGRDVSIKIAAATAGLDAASILNIKELSIDFSKNVMRDYALSSVQAIDILNQKFEITGTLTLDLGDDTYKDYMLDGGYKALRIDIVNANVTIGSTNPAFRLDLSRVAFDAWEPARPNDEIATQTINFRAMYDITNGNIINNCYLVNETASY